MQIRSAEGEHVAQERPAQPVLFHRSDLCLILSNLAFFYWGMAPNPAIWVSEVTPSAALGPVYEDQDAVMISKRRKLLRMRVRACWACLHLKYRRAASDKSAVAGMCR